jgi:hypothetical protein
MLDYLLLKCLELLQLAKLVLLLKHHVIQPGSRVGQRWWRVVGQYTAKRIHIEEWYRQVLHCLMLVLRILSKLTSVLLTRGGETVEGKLGVSWGVEA